METLEGKSFEPPMFLQRPSLGRSQDVSHILASAFRDLTRDTVGEQTVRNLTVSRSGEERYHEEYVERLANIQAERQRQLDELAMVEAHILQARAAATAAEEQELRRATEECKNYESLGLPPVKSHLRYCMDIALLKKYKLITPDDYVPTQHQATEAPRGSPVPSYARPTTSSMLHFNKGHVPDNYMDIAETQTYPFTSESPEYSEKFSSEVSPPKTEKSKVSLSWRDSIKPDQRHKERASLQRLNAKSEYLRNSRHVPPSYPTLTKTHRKISQKGSTKEQSNASVPLFKSSDILIPSPSPVVFEEYEVGEVYEIKLELKNVSSSMRQIRIIPPATKFFSIGLGQYPGDHGMIAPGMNCKFAVKFAPDSLTDYEDKIQIRTQLDDCLEILLLGKRKPPELTLTTVLDAGYCLVGGTKTVTFNCLNTGGPGSFCIVEESSWPTTSCKWSLDSTGYLALEPFRLQPALFQLLKGQEISLQLTFQPLSAKYYKHQVFMVCDNCQVKRFVIQGVGQTAGVEFVSVDGGVAQSLIGESSDLSADYLVRFLDQNPCTTKIKNLVVKNMSNIALPFNWQMMKPCLRRPGTELISDTNQWPKQSYDEHSVFSIEPASGILQPCSNFDFKIDCSSSEIGDFHSVAHLVLEKVPVLRSAKNQGQIEEDQTSLKIELKVACQPFQINVNPSILVIPGKLLIGKLYKYFVKVKNNGVSKTRYEWPAFDNESVVTIEPRVGRLDAGEEQTVEVTVCGQRAGSFASTVRCYVRHSAEPIYVYIATTFEGPRVKVNDPDQDFGLVRFGNSVCEKISLSNLSEVPASWSLREAPYYHLIDVDQHYKEMPSEFEFYPQHGQLPPFAKTTVDVVFTPLKCRRVRSVLECVVTEGPTSYIPLFAEVQNPEICIPSSAVIMEEVYVNVPFMKHVEIENKTLLETKFHWLECLGGDARFCNVQLQPNEGVLGPRERKEITVLFTGRREGALTDLVAVCDVEGMDESVCATFEGTVRGLEVSFRTEIIQKNEKLISCTEDQANITLDFGKSHIEETPKALLILSNKTAIKTSYSVEVEHYHAAKTPTPPLGGLASGKIRGQILAKSPNIADPLSKTPSKAHADFCRALLKDGRGAALVCSPSCGELLPFEEHVIEVVAYSDMWGEYRDNLICKIDGLIPKYIPFTLNVEGSPLNFQITKDKSPIIRFGSHVSGASAVERVLRVNNTGPCDIRVDWEVYNEDADDSQLIDLIIDVGDPFPRIVNGKEKNSSSSDGDNNKPLISANVRKHIGRRSDLPFSVKPCQQIIPARKHSDIRVIFNPYSSITTDVSFLSFALGFISLDKSEEIRGTYVTRCIGRDKDPFRLNMSGAIKPAILSINVADDEGSHFKTFASDLMKLTAEDSFETLKEVHKSSHYTLCNTSQASVSFYLDIERPFAIMNINAPPSACQDKSKAIKGRKIALKPQKNAQVGIGFCLSHDMLSNKEHEKRDVTSSSENGVLPTLEMQKNLLIHFTNGISQTLPLSATVYLPHVLLSKEKVDFGVCFIGQPKEMSVKLTNFGKSSSYWFVEKDTRYPEESRQVFDVHPSKGYLEGHTSHISENSVLLKLTFIPRHNVSYECLLVFKGLLYEEPRYLLLSACGSYDGGHEELISTATV